MLSLMHRATNGIESHHAWYVGEIPLVQINPAWIHGIYAVQADGDELNHVARNFRNLPLRLSYDVSHPIQRWYGDDAKFIAGNL